MAFISKKHLPRRTFLQGMGITLALPLLDSMIPAASEEETVDGEFRFHFGPLEPGDRLQYKLDGQLNPSLVGSIQGPIRLLDGDREIVRHDYRLTVLP